AGYCAGFCVGCVGSAGFCVGCAGCTEHTIGADAGGGTMSEHDVPAERDELREKLRHLTRDPGPLGSAVCALLKAAEAEVPVMVMPDESRAILDLLAAVREAPPI